MVEIQTLKEAIRSRREIVFSYLHGSSLYSDKPRDLDVAVYLDREEHERLRAQGRVLLDFVIPLELELERTVGRKIDVQALNQAPLQFRCRVVTQGIVLLDRNPLARERFEYLARVEYFDFRPRHLEYLREAASR